MTRQQYMERFTISHFKYTDDGSTVNLYDYTGCSDCSCTPTLRTDFNVNFNPAANPGDTFNCTGEPCPYYIIEDGTAHPSGECPFDVGKGGIAGGNYATWHRNEYPVLWPQHKGHPPPRIRFPRACHPAS